MKIMVIDEGNYIKRVCFGSYYVWIKDIVYIVEEVEIVLVISIFEWLL